MRALSKGLIILMQKIKNNRNCDYFINYIRQEYLRDTGCANEILMKLRSCFDTSKVSQCVCVCVFFLTLPPQLILHGLHSSLLLDEVVDDLGRLAVLQLSLRDAAHVKQVLQFRIQVVELQHQQHRSL